MSMNGIWDQRAIRRLKLRELRILHEVLQAGSMAGAATRLAMSQPAVSKAIADLERTVGVRLLDRVARGVEPTPYSRALLQRGTAIFDELGQALKDIDFLRDPAAGELRLGGTEPITAGFLSAIIDKFARQYPRISFRLVQSDTATLLFRELRERNVELVIGRMSGSRLERDIEAEQLFTEELFVVVGHRSRWATRRKIRLEDIIDEPWILSPPESPAGALVEEAFQAAGLELPYATVVSFSVSLRDTLLQTGRYVTVLRGSLLQLGARNKMLAVLPVKLPVQPRPIGLFKLKNRTLSRLADLFIKDARQLAKSVRRTGLQKNS